jgi:hypothetical protein
LERESSRWAVAWGDGGSKISAAKLVGLVAASVSDKIGLRI